MRTPSHLSASFLERIPADVSLEVVRSEVLPEALTWLDSVEKERFQSFLHPDRRTSFALGRVAARAALAKRMGCSPEEVRIVIGEDRAPRVVDTPLRVSIAHTGREESVVGAAAVSTAPVGIDLERIVERNPALRERILQPSELEFLDDQPGKSGDLVLLWSLKEAVLKALRTGLRRPVREILLTQLNNGDAAADAGDSGAWNLAYERLDDVWVSVAWPEQG